MFVEASNLLDCGKEGKAFHLFLRAAQLGHSHAQHNVGLLLELGTGTKVDKPAAIGWYVRSWRRNPQLSTAENLSLLYAELGKHERARFWKRRADGLK